MVEVAAVWAVFVLDMAIAEVYNAMMTVTAMAAAGY